MLFQLECLDVEDINGGGTDFFTKASNEFDLNSASSNNFKNMKRIRVCGSNELSNSASMKKVFPFFFYSKWIIDWAIYLMNSCFKVVQN